MMYCIHRGQMYRGHGSNDQTYTLLYLILMKLVSVEAKQVEKELDYDLMWA